MFLIDIYGLVIKCESGSPGLEEELKRPFAYFLTGSAEAIITVRIEEKEPPYKEFPSLEATFSTPRNIVYASNNCKIIDYFGKAVTEEKKKDSSYRIYCHDRGLLFEVFYLLVLSLVGQHCDKNGILRIHALGLSYKGKAFIVLMPPGTGKSSMALAMLAKEGFKIISDDSPLFSSQGSILPFPSHIGVLDKDVAVKMPQNFIYPVQRMEFGLKYFIDYGYFKDKTEKTRLRDIVIVYGRRFLNRDPSIRRTSKMDILSALFRDAVIGVGLYQGIEFIFSHSAREVLVKSITVFRRFLLALKLVFSSRSFQADFSQDLEKNIAALTQFIEQYPAESRQAGS